MPRYFRKVAGRLCYLSPIDPDDYLRYTEWLNDLEVLTGLNLITAQVSSVSERDAVARLATSAHHYAIVDSDSDALLGNCGLHQLDHVNATATVGIFIGDKTRWSRGYGTEALTLLLDYGFSILNLHSVMLEVFSYNKRAIACYHKVGFREIGCWRESKLVAGRRYDRVLMDITAAELVGGRLGGLVERVHGGEAAPG
jgi:RimJ/RimL family protein N-acetyltransferase